MVATSPPSRSRLASAGRGLATLVMTLAAGAAGLAGAGPSQRPDGLYAELQTDKGAIVVRLEHERAPLAVASFVGLAEGTIENAAFDLGRPFYDGTAFHRVVPGHVIQAGVPDSDEAESPGYTFPNQIHASMSHDHAGAVGVANGGPHTNGAQFYITLADRSYLDGDYIVFGEVVEGMDVVDAITRGDIVDSVRILRIGSQAESFRPDTSSFGEMVREAEQRAAAADAAKGRAEREWIERNWPDAEGGADGIRTLEQSGPSRAAVREQTLQVRYRGTAVRYRGHLLGHEGPELDEIRFGSGEDGSPGFFDPPQTFRFEPGVTSITPALDELLAQMAPGERRVVVVPADLGYGRSGYYGPNRPGERRFVISPNTMLVYEIEILDRGPF